MNSSDRIGQLLTRKYRIEGLLARGGMGVVYAARHETTGRSVAVKLLLPELVTQSDLVRRVSAEARLAVSASHPNVVQVIDAGADEQAVPYLVLERLYGCTLQASLTEAWPLRLTMQALVPIVNALATLHAAGIVHRDIKPSNIFLSVGAGGRVTPKLLDFGIAKALRSSSATLPGTALGTPAYMAPEQILGFERVSPATDVWAMGVVFVRALTGRLPGETDAATRSGLMRHGLQATDLPGIAQPVAQVLADALRPEACERPADMSAFRASLLSALTQTDENEHWPNEGTVHYAADQFDLKSLPGAPEGTTVGGVAIEQPASAERPRERRTRSLSSTLLQRLAPTDRARGWPFALAAVVVGRLVLGYGALRIAHVSADPVAVVDELAAPADGVLATPTDAIAAEPPSAGEPRTVTLSLTPSAAPVAEVEHKRIAAGGSVPTPLGVSGVRPPTKPSPPRPAPLNAAPEPGGAGGSQPASERPSRGEEAEAEDAPPDPGSRSDGPPATPVPPVLRGANRSLIID
jgi:serine/threonine-protein kinase